jgi:hypothetical protein
VTILPKLLLIIGGCIVALTVGGGLFLGWFLTTGDQRAEDAALSACAELVREAGGDPSDLRPAEVLEANGTTVAISYKGATINGRAVICSADGYQPGRPLSNTNLTYQDGTPVEPR